MLKSDLKIFISRYTTFKVCISFNVPDLAPTFRVSCQAFNRERIIFINFKQRTYAMPSHEIINLKYLSYFCNHAQTIESVFVRIIFILSKIFSGLFPIQYYVFVHMFI